MWKYPNIISKPVINSTSHFHLSSSQLSVHTTLVIRSMAFEAGSSNAKKINICKMTTKKEAYALIVDDESTIHMLHKGLLSRFGYKTFTAENGKQVVELFQYGAHFDLITMDFQMPIMDGIEATKTLRDMGVDSKILGVSACAEASVKELFIEAGVDHFLTKPLTVDKLASFLKNI